jgi:hypothetical protein
MKKAKLILTSSLLTILIVSSIPFLNASETDYVIEGNEILQITDDVFTWSSNLTLKDNAELILDNGTLQIVEDSPQQYCIVLSGHSKIILKNNSTLEYGGPFARSAVPISVADNSYLEVYDSTISVGVAAGDSSEVQLKNSGLSRGLGVNGFSKAAIENSSIYLLGIGDRANVTVPNSNISNLDAVGNSEFRAVDSGIGYGWQTWEGIYWSTDENSSIWMTNCSLGVKSDREELKFNGFSTVWLIDCDLGKGNFDVQGFGAKVFIAYSLTVDVEAENGALIEDVLVSVYYSHDNTLAEQAKTDSEGKVKFVLPQWIIQKFGGTYTGEYKIVTNFDNGYTETDVTLDSSKEIVISPPASNIFEGISALTTLETVLLVIAIILFSVIVALIYFIKSGRAKQNSSQNEI